MKSIRILSLLLALVLLCTGCAAGGAAEATPAPDMSDLPLDGGYAYLRVEVLSRDKDAKTLEVKVLDFGDADGVNVGALPVGAQGTADCSDLLSMAMMIDSGEWIITYADLGQQAFPLRLTSIENPEHFAERAGKKKAPAEGFLSRRFRHQNFFFLHTHRLMPTVTMLTMTTTG